MPRIRTDKQREAEKVYRRRRRERLGDLYNEYYRNYRKGIIISLPRKEGLSNEEKKARKKERNRGYARIYRLKNTHKVQARNEVTKALRHKKLARLPRCENCQVETKTEAHHENYSRPLDVKWLCHTCHVSVGRVLT